MSPIPESALHRSMTAQLTRRQANSSLRSLTLSPATSIDFSSNDFLSLSSSSLLRTSFLSSLCAVPNFRLGSTGSRLLDGNSPYAEQLEREIAAFHHAPAAVLFNSGFDANAGFFACVPQKDDVIVYDALIHASVHEGMRVSRVPPERRRPFRHNCLESLRLCLEDARASETEKRGVFVAVESLYSMDGDLAPLAAIVDLVEEIFPDGNAHIIVDEAHSTGIYGSKGRGLVCSLGLEDRIFARLHTFGKALGCNGAILLCDELTRSYLINYARPLIYTTFMSFPSLAAIKAAYTLLQSGATERRAEKLQELIQLLYTKLQTPLLRREDAGYGLLTIPHQIPKSPIFSILSPRPKELAKWCQEAGFVVRAIVSPTVPVGTERIRVCLHAENSAEEIERLVGTMQRWVEMQGEKQKKVVRESRL
ncbi:aminotransferase class I and II [Phlyctema vagabunda]|uniref:Aminotransferase class I and II n=1 Tax=Phlyctema vagabunda TaxID=108571 RepID=A0ABR4PVV3_9HELO